MGWLENFISQVLVSVGVLFTLTVVGFIVYGLTELWTRRRPILRLFGITRKCPELTVYLSNIHVTSSTGIMPIAVGTHGDAIDKIEYDAALEVQRLLSSKWLALVPGGLRARLGRLFVSLAPCAVAVDVSPPATRMPTSLPVGNAVLVGTGIYNSYCYLFLGGEASRFTYGREPVSQERAFGYSHSTTGTSPWVEGRELHPPFEVAIIQRLTDSTGVKICCAGLGSQATAQSLMFLARNWRGLMRASRGKDFALVLRYPATAKNELVRGAVPELILESGFTANPAKL